MDRTFTMEQYLYILFSGLVTLSVMAIGGLVKIILMVSKLQATMDVHMSSDNHQQIVIDSRLTAIEGRLMGNGYDSQNSTQGTTHHTCSKTSC